MKKLLIPILLLLTLVLSACGNSIETKTDTGSMVTYQAENGPVEVPKNPQRVVALFFGGNVLALDANVVGIDVWAPKSPLLKDQLKDVEVVSEENLEKIIELDPDLIIGLSTTKNLDKLKEIAPTVTYTYGKLDYLTQHLEIAKLLNKEEEAQAWINDFKQRAQVAGEEIKAKIGEDATVTVIENFDKQIYVFGNNWGRGTEIIYQEMKLKMPEKVEEVALKPGYYLLSPEALPEYIGDYLIISKYSDTDNSYMETKTYQNIPAVRNNQTYEVNAYINYFNDPTTLEYQLDFLKKSFLGQ
ncbi:iron-hydroxamate ABC transporter substrate-binding protein [Hazenella sp. IB182357]|uniref:Iron-hydroxamate ABC transporter substrate-binding protein n=1 Tax=Polycladospora coralii TaxID=2771432 RepID=A0A926NDR6_9BACL|nr:iron-hydroxamate ABC transporter substrate-binding protein [Polycladospora coralii]MBD1373535.1 iron-hydroxamate ABC transporter substrate-binding protein [Polycladospora coralii]